MISRGYKYIVLYNPFVTVWTGKYVIALEDSNFIGLASFVLENDFKGSYDRNEYDNWRVLRANEVRAVKWEKIITKLSKRH